MSAVPAARFLADFGAPADAAPLGGAKADESSAARLAAKVDEAYGRGLLTGRATAAAQFNVKINEQREAFAVELAAERQKWAEEAGQALTNQLYAAIADFEMRIADTTARILKPFLEAGLRQQAISELQANLNTLVMADPGVGLQITGPQDVLEAIAAQLADKTITVTYVPSEDCDVKVVAGPATLETCLRGWADRLEELTR
jgi:hypothetical protein